MAIPRIPEDGKHWIQNHEQRLKRLHEGVRFPSQCRQAAVDSAGRLLDRQVEKLLGEIPVETLNQQKQGIRVKTLRDQGYDSLGKLHGATVYQLEAISGISPEGARTIKNAVDLVARQAREGARIRLSLDDRNPDSTALVQSLVRYRLVKQPGKECGDLLNQYERGLQAAIQAMAPAAGSLKWLFAGRARKEQAHQAYRYLTDRETMDFGPRADSLLQGIAESWNLTEDGLWQYFAENSIAVNNLLESFCPGILGAEEEGCGLPEVLAREVEQETIDLTGLRCELRRYQQWGVRYILHQKRVLLGDEMGLGKTVQAIGAMVARRNAGENHFLVVCPASVLENWCREIRKHSDLPVYKVYGEDKEEIQNTWISSGGVGVTTYDGAEVVLQKPKLRLGMIVVDEAHYIKNPQAKRTQRLRKLCTQGKSLLFMTGTALENRVEEMISLISVLQPQVAAVARSMAALSAAPQFREAVAPVYYRRRREDVLKELPDLIETEQWCTLLPGERAVYEQEVLEGSFMGARRVSWNAPDPALSAKGQRLLEILEDAREEGRKVIVFSYFLDTIQRVRRLVGESCMLPINGSVAPAQRQQIVDEFEKAPAGAVLPAQIQAGGTGLNIQTASVVVICEPQLKPSIENQAISRAYRMGQTRNVLVYRLLAEDTVDERILMMLRDKQAAFDAYADESVAGRESLELDQAAFGDIMEQEKTRIRAGLPAPAIPTVQGEVVEEPKAPAIPEQTPERILIE